VIFSAGLSPAWQQILTFDTLQTGQVNRVREAIWCASGKVINVAVAAQTLGAPVSLSSTIGGLSGDVIEQELSQLGIHAAWVRTESTTRVCTTLLPAQGPTTELVEETPEITEKELAQFFDQTLTYANVADVVVFTGSQPKNVPPETFAQIMRQVHKKFVLDLRGPSLQFCLPFVPFLIKPNREELETTLGIKIQTEQELLAAMRRMNDGGAAWVVVSDGENGLFVTSEEDAYRLLPARVPTVNPIGCGDSLAAGIAVKLLEEEDVIKAVAFGMGAAANNAEQLLPVRLDPERSRELADQVTIQEVSVP